ncbi:MAG: DsbA family protein [Nocardioidaceae bacterium]
MTDSVRTPVDFWFDPACPWAWLTSRWILNAEEVRPIQVDFHVMSLFVLNEDKIETPSVKERLLGPVRVLMAAAQGQGESVLRDLYTEIGNRVHPGRTQMSKELVADALAAAGIDARYLDAWDSEEYDEAIRKSHTEGMELVGYDVGTPVIRVEGDAFFGPIVTPAPKGEQAGQLWDGFRQVAAVPGFYEIKRTRDTQPDFS